MKIWIINHYAEIPPEGNYLRHFRFAKELIGRGHDVEIFSASTIHNSDINLCRDARAFKKRIVDGVPVTLIKCRNYQGSSRRRVLNFLDFFFGVLKVTRRLSPPDIVYSSSPHPLNWIAAARIAGRTGARHLAETRDLWPETFVALEKLGRNNPLVKALYALEKHIYEKADALIFTFPGYATYLRERGIRPSGSTYYLNNGVCLEEFDRQARDYPCLDEAMQSDAFKVVYTGALGLVNGMHLLLEAARLLKDRARVEFIVYGEGAQRRQLEEEARDLPVTFMGRVEKQRIPGILAKADLALMLTRKTRMHYEMGTSLNKLFEYLASGTPVLSNIATKYDLVESSRSGITVGSEDPSDLAQGILRFVQAERPLYDEYCRNARKTAEEYDFSPLTDQLEAILAALWENGKKGQP